MADILHLLTNNSLCDLTGNRFWLDGISKEPGLVADKCSYITFRNIAVPHFLRVQVLHEGQSVPLKLSNYSWSPAGIASEFHGSKLKIREKKYITKEDIFAVVLSMENTDSAPQQFDLKVSTLLSCVKSHFRSLYNPNYIEYENEETNEVKMRLMIDVTARNVLRTTTQANVVFYSPQLTVNEGNDTFCGTLRLAPGECAEVSISGSISHVDSLEDLHKKVIAHSARNLWTENAKQVTQWFDKNIPQFSCSDPVLEKLYYYRWYIVYKNLINPQIDCFQDLCMYEGKDQFSLLCSASAAMHIRELRWLRNPRYVMSEMKVLHASQVKEGRDKGRLRDLYISDLPTAIWETCCLLPDRERREVVHNRSAVLQYVQYQHSDRFLPASAPLPIVVGSWRTAAEYQPSFFEFTQPQWDHELSNPFGKEHQTKLHRVDDATYLCTNMASVGKIYGEAKEYKVAVAYADRSDQLRQRILHHMWDEETKFFYDLCPTDLHKALQSKTFSGFLGARIDPDQQSKEALMDHLYQEFHTPYPIPTVATDCPAFSPNNTWTVGPHASQENPYTYDCCWNGPSWNFANSLVLDTLGRTIQTSVTRRQQSMFADLFHKWCLEQCPGPDAVPNSCEHYDPFTGEELRAVRDYSHSTFVDILIRRVIGICEHENNILQCQPIDIGLTSLEVSDIPYKGHTVDFRWNKNQKDAMQVFFDKQLIYKSEQLSDFEFDFGKDGHNG